MHGDAVHKYDFLLNELTRSLTGPCEATSNQEQVEPNEGRAGCHGSSAGTEEHRVVNTCRVALAVIFVAKWLED